MKADSPEFGLLQTLKEVSILHVIHFHALTFFPTDRLTVFPNDPARPEKYPFRNHVLSFCQILGLTPTLEVLQFLNQCIRHIDAPDSARLRLLDSATDYAASDDQILPIEIGVTPLEAGKFRR